MARPAAHGLPADELARLAGVSESTWHLHVKAGCPVPRSVKDVQRWLPRYHEWRAKRRRRSGTEAVSLDPEVRKWQEHRAKFLALSTEARFRKTIGELVSRKDVEERGARQALLVRMRLNNMARTLSSRLFQAPSVDWIREQIQGEVDAICAAFARGLVDDGPAAGTPATADGPGEAGLDPA